MRTKLELWQRASNYSGPDFSDYYVLLSQSRDSDLLTTSNFVCALDQLGGETPKAVRVVRFGHWGCGWVEAIMIHKDCRAAVRKAQTITDKLAEYPILDESDFHDRENERKQDDWEYYKTEFTAAVVKVTGSTDRVACEQAAMYLHESACSYSGVEDAFVDDYNIAKLVDFFEYNLPELIETNGVVQQLVTMYSKQRARG